ncbi:MAG: DUF5010 domain-containing protein [Armatimonadota bacterium]
MFIRSPGYMVIITTVVFAILCIMFIVLPAGANKVLRYRVTTSGGDVRSHMRISMADYTFQQGDTVEYDVYLHSNHSGVGGLDVSTTDGAAFRDAKDWVDTNGLSGSPNTDLRSRAYLCWYHRKLPVPDTLVGKTSASWDLTIEGDFHANDVPSAMYDNIRVTHNGISVFTIYTDGDPIVSQPIVNTLSAVHSANLIVTEPRKAGIQTAAHFFYWYDSPKNTDPRQFIYHPRGLSINGPWTGYGMGNGHGYYSAENPDWWEAEFQDLKRAGFDIASIVDWGEHPTMPHFRAATLAKSMVPALERSGVDIKIAMFDDTSSQCCLWNYEHGRQYLGEPRMPLSDKKNWLYFYERKTKPFFEAVPQKHWATHNSLPLEDGGRPIIITWSAVPYDDVDQYGNALWEDVKKKFAQDFKDANGKGITPWIIHEAGWIFRKAGPSGDGVDAWGAVLVGPSIYTLNNNGYYVGNIGWGCNDSHIRKPSTVIDRKFGGWLLDNFGTSYDSQILMQPSEPKRYLWDCNLVVVETWNELFEGTAMDRCVDYPAPDGSRLPETHYIDLFGDKCITSSIGRREYDATFLRTWTLPTALTRNSTPVSMRIRNDGLLPWSSAPDDQVKCAVWLEDLEKGREVSGSRRAFPVSSIVLHGQETNLSWRIPSNWPVGRYHMRLDLIAPDSQPFSSFGDIPVKIMVNVD